MALKNGKKINVNFVKELKAMSVVDTRKSNKKINLRFGISCIDDRLLASTKKLVYNIFFVYAGIRDWVGSRP